jgi:hypothetical protein
VFAGTTNPLVMPPNRMIVPPFSTLTSCEVSLKMWQPVKGITTLRRQLYVPEGRIDGTPIRAAAARAVLIALVVRGPVSAASDALSKLQDGQ